MGTALDRARAALVNARALAVANRAGRARWSQAQSVADLCELTARWCEGELVYHPNGYNLGPDPETLLMAGELAALNRAGMLTFNSQAGESYDYGEWGSWVAAFTDEATATRIQQAAPPHVRVSVYAPSAGRWRQRVWPASGPPPGGNPDQVWERMSPSERDAEFGGLDDDLYDEVAQMWQITVADIRPGVNDMWSWLVQAAGPDSEGNPAVTRFVPTRSGNEICSEDWAEMLTDPDHQGHDVELRLRAGEVGEMGCIDPTCTQASDLDGDGSPRVGNYKDRIRAAWNEVEETGQAAEAADAGPNDGTRSVAYEGQLRAGENFWRALAGKDPKPEPTEPPEKKYRTDDTCGRFRAPGTTPSGVGRTNEGASSMSSMSSIAEIRSALAGVAEGLPQRHIQEARGLIQESLQQLHAEMDGSNNEEITSQMQVLAQQDDILQGVQQALGGVVSGIESGAARL